MESNGASASDLHGRKREIVGLLAARPRMSVSQLANALGLTAGGVRQQLAQLESAGAIVHEPGPGGRGRFFYSLAPGTGMPRNRAYHRFVVRLLQAIDANDGDALRRAAAHVREPASGEPSGQSSAARIGAVRRILEEEGFSAQLETLGRAKYSLRLRSCPVEELAAEFRSLCEAEEECLARLLAGFDLERAAWRFEGAPECRYLIGERAG